MKLKFSKTNILRGLTLTLALGAFSACKEDSVTYNPTIAKPAITFYGLTSYSSTTPSALIRYNSANINLISAAPLVISGLQTGESILAIDYRPADNAIYGIGSTSRLYKITVTSSAATATVVGTGPLSPVLSGSVAAFDFNPVADRLRIVTTSGQNLRVNPADATVTVDGAINGVVGARITGCAYTNNVKTAVTTELYSLDVAAQNLYKQEPNSGALTLVGTTGLTPLPTTNSAYLAAYNTTLTNAGINATGGFDIAPSGVALAVFTSNVVPAIPINGLAVGNPLTAVSANNGLLTLYQIDLATGKALDLGVVPIPAAANYASASSIIGLAIVLP